MAEYIFLFVIFFQSITLCTVIYFSHIERKDLYDRLMSKSFDEYQKHTSKDEAHEEDDEDDESIPLEDARTLIDKES